MLDDAIKITGRLQLELLDEHGLLRAYTEIDNLVVNAGKGQIADRMKAVPAIGAVSHVAVGTGAVAPAPGDDPAKLGWTRLAAVDTRPAGFLKKDGGGGRQEQVSHAPLDGACGRRGC